MSSLGEAFDDHLSTGKTSSSSSKTAKKGKTTLVSRAVLPFFLILVLGVLRIEESGYKIISKSPVTAETKEESTEVSKRERGVINAPRNSVMDHVNASNKSSTSLLTNEEEAKVSSTSYTTALSKQQQQQQRRTSTRIFSNTRQDRSGSAIQDMLMAHAYAYREHADYGGACGSSDYVSNSQELLDSIGLKDILPFQCPSTSKDMLLDRTRYFTSEDIRIWTPEWIQYMQQYVRFEVEEPSSPAYDNNHQFLIVVHIRRGDINPCCWEGRYLPNSHYLTLIEKYLQGMEEDDDGKAKEKRKNPKVVIFSESNSFESFDDFRNRGYEVILDGDPSHAWKTMIVADVLILSKSSFSLVPAVLNTKKDSRIVYTKFNHLPLRGWDIVDNALNLKSKKETHKLLKRECPGSGIVCGA